MKFKSASEKNEWNQTKQNKMEKYRQHNQQFIVFRKMDAIIKKINLIGRQQ